MINTERIQIELHIRGERVHHEPFVWSAVPRVGDIVQWTCLETAQIKRSKVREVVWCAGTRYPNFFSAKVEIKLDNGWWIYD